MRVSDMKLLSDRGYEPICNGEIIGEGAYSKVQLFHSKLLNKDVAIKIINKTSAPRDFVQHFLPREIQVLQRVRHMYIVDIFEILATNDGRVFVAMEYAEYCDLLKHIQHTGALDETRCKYLFRQLAEAIQYLHDKKIVHRDLKCENLLLTRKKAANAAGSSQSRSTRPAGVSAQQQLPKLFEIDQVKLIVADFGFSKMFDSDDELSRTFCGSAAYAAPEIIKGEPYLLKNHDMWSLGVILFIMSCGTMPFDDSNVRKMLKDQMDRRIKLPPSAAERLSPDCKDLIYKLIEPDSGRRYTISQVLAHQWLNGTPARVTKVRELTAPCINVDKASVGTERRKDSVAEAERGSLSEEGREKVTKNSAPKFWW